MRVAITGATGFIGRHLTAALAEAGHRLIILTRGHKSFRTLRGATVARWHPSTGLDEPARADVNGADAVIHLAGEPIAARRWTPAQKQRIRESRVHGTKALVNALAALPQPPRTFLCASASGYYGDRGDEVLSEQSPPGSDFLSQVCIGWEQEARRAEEWGARTVCLRFGLVLGTGGGALPRLLLPFRLGLGGPLGSGHHWWPWIHIDDAVHLILFALEESAIKGPVNVTSPSPVRNDDFTRTLAAVLRRPAFIPVPALVLRTVLGEMAQALLASQRVMPQVALSNGFSFRYPQLRPALEQLLARTPPPTR